MLSERALAKVRSLDQGHAYVEATWRAIGAPPRRGRDPVAWLWDALVTTGVRRVRHPGNHRYLFALGNRAKRRAVIAPFAHQPYSKQVDQPIEGMSPERAGAVCEWRPCADGTVAP